MTWTRRTFHFDHPIGQPSILKESAMTTIPPNGRATRKNLASEIDRLDRLLDGLAENLNEAIADAVQAAVSQAVRAAVEAALTEVLTSPELRQRLQQAAPPPPAPAPAPQQPHRSVQRLRSAWNWARVTLMQKASAAATELGQARSWIGSQVRRSCAALCQLCRQAVSRGTQAWEGATRLLPVLWQCRSPLLLALGVGLVLGVGCYLAGPFVAATVSGLAGFAGSLMVSAMGQLYRLLTLSRIANT
jgi:hypothetical protein